MTAPLLRHRPAGIEHPYATSLDQRVPVLPMVGEPVVLGVEAEAAVTAVTCEWAPLGADGAPGEPVVLDLAPHTATEADAAALAGGEGHLAAAQAASLGGEGGWAVTSPPVDAGVRLPLHRDDGERA